MTSDTPIQRFALSTEELALALGLAGNAEAGRSVLRGLYEDITPEKADLYLTAASHSLLAHDLCTIASNGMPQLDPGLALALRSLSEYDYLLNLSLVSGQKGLTDTIRVARAAGFTSHFVRAGAAHVLERGPVAALPGFLADLLESFASDHAPRLNSGPAPTLTLGALGQALEASRKGSEVRPVLQAAGWTAAQAEALVADLEQQVFRGSLLRVEAGSDTPPEQVAQADQRTMLLLKGPERSWVFDFASTQDTAEATAMLVTREQFNGRLRQFAL